MLRALDQAIPSPQVEIFQVDERVAPARRDSWTGLAIYRAALLFMACALLLVALLIWQPWIALFLPALAG